MTPQGDQLFTYEGRPVLLQDRIVLSGESITSAASSFDQNSRHGQYSTRREGRVYIHKLPVKMLNSMAVVYIGQNHM